MCSYYQSSLVAPEVEKGGIGDAIDKALWTPELPKLLFLHVSPSTSNLILESVLRNPRIASIVASNFVFFKSTFGDSVDTLTSPFASVRTIGQALCDTKDETLYVIHVQDKHHEAFLVAKLVVPSIARVIEKGSEVELGLVKSVLSLLGTGLSNMTM